MFYNINNANPYNTGSVSSNGQITENISASVGTESSQSQNADSTGQPGLSMLENMLAGEIFSGRVTGMDGNTVTLTLGNGISLPATLLENAQVQIGQNITFQVNENIGNQISIKPMAIDAQQQELINRVLDAADLPGSGKNITIVKELLAEKMAINNETVLGLVRNSIKFPNADINTLVRLTKLDMPITQENIIQFEAYKNYEHSMTAELTQAGSDFAQFLVDLSQQSGTHGALSFSEKLVDIFYPNTIANASDSEKADVNVNTKPLGNTLAVTDNIDSKQLATHGEFISNTMDETVRDSLIGKLENLFGKDAAASFSDKIKNGNLSAGDFFKELNELMKQNPDIQKSNLTDLFSSKEFELLTKQMVRDRMMLNPQDVREEDGIKNFYKNLKDSIARVTDAAQELSKDSNLVKNLDTIKSNVDFMNDLNRNMSYFQLPVKFSQKNANGELYVFTNKKSLANKSDTVSALLHLDMENLGPIDIYVKLAGKNVSTNFCLESEEMLLFIEEHIEELNQRLEDLDYHTQFEAKVRDKETNKISFVDDFLDKGVDKQPISQYVFDTKA